LARSSRRSRPTENQQPRRRPPSRPRRPGYGFGARIDFRDKTTRERIAQGTELQRCFMINYNLYRHYFPLMALGRARTFLAE
jgi:hypothetical protein